MTASPRSPSPSLAPSGTVRASLVSVLEKIYRRRRLGHESSFGQTGPLCDLYPRLHRAWPRPTGMGPALAAGDGDVRWVCYRAASESNGFVMLPRNGPGS